MIKKFLNYFVICTIAFFGATAVSSCGDGEEDDNGIVNEDPDNDGDDDDDVPSWGLREEIVGIWYLVAEDGCSKENGEVTDRWDYVYDPAVDYYKFNDDGTLGIYTNGKLEDVARWKQSDNDKLLISKVGDNEDYITEYIILELSRNYLVIGNSSTYTYDGDPTTYERLVRMRFERH